MAVPSAPWRIVKNARHDWPRSLINAINVISPKSPKLHLSIRHCLCNILLSPSTDSLQLKTKMPSNTIPRIAMRSLSRATTPLRSRVPRVATRCLHQKSSPITSSPARLRPRAQPWTQGAISPSATVARRTMFIQTEPTPNVDV